MSVTVRYNNNSRTEDTFPDVIELWEQLAHLHNVELEEVSYDTNTQVFTIDGKRVAKIVR